MAAPLGNQFWKQRSSHGDKPIFAEPEQLLQACAEYFEWVDNNPLQEIQVHKMKEYREDLPPEESLRHEPIPRMRAMTLSGLLIFLDIARSTWDSYRAKEGFAEVTTRVYDVIRTQKFEGAAGGFLNPVIIARDLGLVDNKQISGPDDGPVQIEIQHDDYTIARALAEILEEAVVDEGDEETEK